MFASVLRKYRFWFKLNRLKIYSFSIFIANGKHQQIKQNPRRSWGKSEVSKAVRARYAIHTSGITWRA